MSNKPIRIAVSPERQRVIDDAVQELLRQGWTVLHSAGPDKLLRSPTRDGKRN